MKFKHHYNRHEFKSDGEVNEQPSKTIPDQTLPIKTILERYAKGLPVDGQKVPIYNGEDDTFIDFNKMDLAEKQQFMLENAELIQDLKRKLDEQQNQKPDPITPAVVISE